MSHQPTAEQINHLTDALLDAFNYGELIQLVSDKLERDMDWLTPITGKRDPTIIVTDLVAYFASREEGLNQLLVAAQESNPNSDRLKMLASEWSELEFEPINLSDEHPQQTLIMGDNVDDDEPESEDVDDNNFDGDKIGKDRNKSDQYNIDELGDLAAVDHDGRIKIHGPIILGGEHPTDDSAETIEPTPGLPPYKGLSFFNVEDADIFFGRETLIAELVQHIKQHSFLAVIGTPGSGKSSLVSAGLVPVLQGRKALPDGIQLPPGSEDWSIHLITPTARPLERLAASLTVNSKSITATSTLIDDMHMDKRSLHLYTQRMLHSGLARQRVLLVIDQFEKIFTLCRDQAEREAYVENVLYAAGIAPEGYLDRYDWQPCIVVLTLRSDFYDNCAAFSGLYNALEEYQWSLGPMEQNELRRAIISPLEANGWQYEPNLIDQLLRDVGNEPGQLALLSHALLETWKRRQGHLLTLSGYFDSGRVQDAITMTSEQVYSEYLTDIDRDVARNMFLRLTQLGEGNRDTVRSVTLNEFISDKIDAQAVRNVLQTLSNARLITIDEDKVEVTHEAIIREWPRLRNWLDADREGLRTHRRLTEAANNWDNLNRDPSMLYRGGYLERMQEWAEEYNGDLNQLEEAFLDASSMEQFQPHDEKLRIERKKLRDTQDLVDAAQARLKTQEKRAARVEKLIMLQLNDAITQIETGIEEIYQLGQSKK
ncbi:hypothetical protein KFU94_23425 [Chloroflexi bacterium TSY]|nr:hypothetical protein [Chloroflexi bacterium TSY]